MIVTAGTWTSTLLREMIPLPRLVVTQEQPAHFVARSAMSEAELWPGFNHTPTPGDPAYSYWFSPIYGMYAKLGTFRSERAGVGVRDGADIVPSSLHSFPGRRWSATCVDGCPGPMPTN